MRGPILALAIAITLVVPTISHAGVRTLQIEVMRDPLNAQAWESLGDHYKKVGNKRQAVTAYQRALSLNPDNPELKVRLAQMNTMRLAALERKALRHPEDDEVWGDLGDKYAAFGDTETALKYYTYAMRIDPGDSEWRGRITALADPETLVVLMAEALENGHLDDEMMGDMADAELARGNVEGACELYQRASEADPADSEWSNSLNSNCHNGYGNYGSINDFSGNLAELMEGAGDMGMGELGSLRGGGESSFIMEGPSGTIGINAGSANAGDAETLLALARSKLLIGEKETSLDLFESALEIEPTNADAIHAVMVLTGRTKLQIVEALVEQLPPNDELYGDLGDTHLSLGNLEGAEAAYEKALELDPNDSEWQSKILVLRSNSDTGLNLAPE